MSRTLVVLGLVHALAGCQLVFGLDGNGDDTPGDAPIDTPTGPLCVDGIVDYCLVDPPIEERTFFATETMNTDTDGRCVELAEPAPPLCVIAARRIVVDANALVSVLGTRPLVLLGLDEIEVNGTLDLSGRGGQPGAGGNDPTCVTNNVINAGVGGGGASFGGVGGSGAGNDTDSATGPAGEPGTLAGLRGGCPGAGGGGVGGDGGQSGGAVVLRSNGRIDIPSSGRIDVCGAGGRGGGATGGGGGGGGSGGMIVFETSDLKISGHVFANGGGGGEGGDAITIGAPGSRSSAPTTAAPGGSTATPDGGNGGVGATGNAAAGSALPGMLGAGGGGGGGGVGVIYVTTEESFPATNVSPPVQKL